MNENIFVYIALCIVVLIFGIIGALIAGTVYTAIVENWYFITRFSAGFIAGAFSVCLIASLWVMED